jgi:leader peptidase (prepilin peptidase) / N-methyltransferase
MRLDQDGVTYRILDLPMIRILGTIFAGLLGLAFGSFLNVCLSRWPAGESIVKPRSHCRHCRHTLAWWENIPFLSWLLLGGRCRQCRAWIGWRYPLVELAVGVLWAYTINQFLVFLLIFGFPTFLLWGYLTATIAKMVLFWFLVGLAVLDAEHLWLPDAITLPGTALGFIIHLAAGFLLTQFIQADVRLWLLYAISRRLLGIAAAAGLILLIRWIYWLVRHNEGIGLGDAKLMALLAAWLGFSQALVAFGLGVFLGALVALVLLAVPSLRRGGYTWAMQKLPLGTFLCAGGIVSGMWGQEIVDGYLRWAGF